MAMRKMTFTIPDEVAAPLLRRIPARQRSKFVTDLLRVALLEREAALVSACDAVNADPVLNALMEDWQATSDPIYEPWHEPPSR